MLLQGISFTFKQNYTNKRQAVKGTLHHSLFALQTELPLYASRSTSGKRKKKNRRVFFKFIFNLVNFREKTR